MDFLGSLFGSAIGAFTAIALFDVLRRKKRKPDFIPENRIVDLPKEEMNPIQSTKKGRVLKDWEYRTNE